MALTIHYKFGYRGSEKGLREKLNWLSTEFTKLPVARVHSLKETRRGYLLAVEIGPGCEWFLVALNQESDNAWKGRGFTKTGFAQNVPVCHKAVVAMLDLCQRAGILEEVNDESGYWDNRDPNIFGPVN